MFEQEIVRAFCVLITSFLFAIGLYCLSSFLLISRFPKFRKPREKSSKLLGASFYILGIIGFCAFCNVVMLLPPLIELLPWVTIRQSLALHQFLMLAIILVILLISLYGALVISNSFGAKNIISRFFPVIALSIENHISCLSTYCRKGFIVISAVFVGFLFVISKGDGLNGDTGLYHLPHVIHLASYGIEWGLANWDLRYTTYSLQFFGQAPFQLMLGGSSISSPSLNILFLSSLLILAVDSIEFAVLNQKGKKHGSISFYAVAVICYFLMALTYGLEPRSSLVSFNPDFALACTAIVAIYHAVFPVDNNSCVFAIALAICMPLLKVTGIVPSVVVIAILSIREFVRSLNIYAISPNDCLAKTFAVINYFNSVAGRKTFKSLIVLACSVLSCYVLTSVVISGYLLPQSSSTGLLLNHTVPSDYLESFNSYGLAFNRIRWSGQSQQDALALSLNPDQWFSLWKSGKEGKILLGSLGVCVLSSCVYSLMTIVKLVPALLLNRQGKSELDYADSFWPSSDDTFVFSRLHFIWSNLSLSIALSLGFSIAIFVGPPQSRFYTWLIGLTFYLALSIVFLSPVLGFLFWSLVSLAALIVGRAGVLQEVPVPRLVKELKYTWQDAGVSPRWRTRAATDLESKSFIFTEVLDPADQAPGCWAASPPCSQGKSESYSN